MYTVWNSDHQQCTKTGVHKFAEILADASIFQVPEG